MKKKKSFYERPAAVVVKLQQQNLMAGTQVQAEGAGVQDYYWNEEVITE